MASILAVDDDPAILDMIQSILRKDGHSVTGISSPCSLDPAKAASFDLILLDIMMPEIDGYHLCRKLRGQVDCPIIFLTAKSEESSLIDGLELGADDYIRKPFGVLELRARISAHLRREKRGHFARISFENASFNLSAKQLTVHNNRIPLTKGEYEICEFLARNQGQVFTKEQILERIFGYDRESNENTIATHIKNIRTKLLKFDYTPIKTVWGVGYKWEE